MRAVALAVSVSLLSSACFPTNPKARTYAKIGEGASLAAGVLMEALTNSGADCTLSMPGEPDSGCKTSASLYGDLGVVLILAGLLGFVSTISTAPDDDDKPHVEIKANTPPVRPMPAAAPAPMPAATPAPAPAPMPAATPAPAPAPVAAPAAGSAG